MGTEYKTVVDIVILLLSLIFILLASEIFTNGVEWLGIKLNVSEGVVGSIFAAVGTALPETLIPIIAVCSFATPAAVAVGVGAIAGAPFMLSTLTIGLCGLSVLIFSQLRRRQADLALNKIVLTRDLGFFIFCYASALLASLAANHVFVRYAVALGLVCTYLLYLYKTLEHKDAVGDPPERLYLSHYLRVNSSLAIVLAQVCLGLAGIVGGAYFFIEYIQDLSAAVGVPQLVLSLIVSPIATELPEKVNSITWARQGKDTLALGNITGALVFQSCFPVAFGVAFTSWKLGPATLVTGVVALSLASIYLLLLRSGKLRAQHLLLGMLAYACTMIWLLTCHCQT